MKFENGFAVESGEVEVYVTDPNGIYSHKATEYVVKGTGLSAGAYLDAPPDAKDGFAIVRKDDEWQYIADHRGETVYSTEDGHKIKIKELGELPSDTTSEPRPSKYHSWWRGKWYLSQDAAAQLLSDKKAQKLAESSNLAQQKNDEEADKIIGLSDMPPFERQMWVYQTNEARAWEQDNSIPTPYLQILAMTSGKELNDVRQEVLDKVHKLDLISAYISSQRLSYKNQINEAKTVEDLDEIKIIYHIDVE